MKKAVTIEDARRTIAQEAGHNGIHLYALTDICQKLDDTFQKQEAFPFDWSDEQIELFYTMMKKRGAQQWVGLDLKMVPLITLNPETHKLQVLFSLFKKAPKGVSLAWSSGSSIGDSNIAPGPNTPWVPVPTVPSSPTSPTSPFSGPLFQPLTQQLDPRGRLSPPPFKLDVSTISVARSDGQKSSTPDKNSIKSKSPNRSNVSNRSIRSNNSHRSRQSERSPIIRPRKRYSPTPRSVRLERSRILDGEPPSKRSKLDRNRPRAKARKSIQRLLANLFQY